MKIPRSAIEDITNPAHPRWNPNWTAANEIECQEIVQRWADREGKSAHSRQHARRTIRKNGLAWAKTKPRYFNPSTP